MNSVGAKMPQLNMNKIKHRIKRNLSSEEALKDIVKIDWTDEILSGKKKVCITKENII